MSIKEQITQDIKTAMKAKEQATLRALRALKAAFMVVETSEGRSGNAITDEEAMKVIMKQAKQRRDSIEQFEANNRGDLAQTEKEELAVIELYLPKQLSAAELETKLQAIIDEVGATSMKDMGKIMGKANQQFAGQADGKAIAATVKKLLA